VSREFPRDEHAPLTWAIAARLHYLDASRNGRPVLAAETLERLVSRDVRPLVQVRCPQRGHFLAAVHNTRYGFLFWTYTTKKRLSPAFQRASQEAAPDHYGAKPLAPLSLRECGFEAEVRDNRMIKDLGFFPTFCRCGQRAILIDDVFDAARTAQAQNRRIVLRAQLCERQ
jgi:hypothetical protein